ncbi:hypothetical protein C1H46_040234 [Malus baccata]|uniref:Uncharacterized protein n=1 Tax=Malus baccata TaxID=106549 RepID=A0A540KJ38_MALBA|nr:hypothetical protein C1H46_040234 [Malus baccata]
MWLGGSPMNKLEAFATPKKSKSARALASSGTPKPPKFLDIIAESEEKHSASEANCDEVVDGGLAIKESNNTRDESDLGTKGRP